ncbi:hypothetical protein ES705_14816 [subsurface metagenome]
MNTTNSRGSLVKMNERQYNVWVNNPENFMDKEYILKPGHRPFIYNVHYDNNSMTDNFARKAIKKDPTQANHFLNDRERKLCEVRIAGRESIEKAEKAV